MRILGISAFYHDSAAALVVDGRVIAAAQEERFTRKKFDAAFPRHAIDYCLRAGGLELTDIDHVVFYDKPFIKFERLLETYLSFSSARCGVVPNGAAAVAAREIISEIIARGRARGDRARGRLAATAYSSASII